MNKKIVSLLMLGMLSGISAQAEVKSYKIDSGHTYPSFEVEHFGLSLQRGRFNQTSGDIQWDKTTGKGSVNVTLQSASIDTGNPDLEKHLKSADFFDVAKYPTLSFDGKNVVMKNDKPVEVQGVLTIKGIKKPVTLKIERWAELKHPITGKPALGVDAVTSIKRSDFGISYSLPGVRDTVLIKLNVEALGE